MNDLKCPLCESTDIATELRPDGYSGCLACNWQWKTGKKEPVLTAGEIQFLKDEFLKTEMKRETVIETIQKMHLEPGDDLVVKLRGEIDEVESMASLREMLEERYPSNRVLVFFLPEGADIDFSVIKKI